MAGTTLLSLPTELLDRIYSYLDWDRTKSLQIARPDIVNLSLTCWHLREAVLPTLFQHVVLKLRWVDGALIEPALYRLRRDSPHLAKFVRSVYIQTEFGQYVDADFVLKGFAVPDDLSDWVNPASLPDDPRRLVELEHREQVNAIARALFKECQDYDLSGQHGADLRQRIGSFHHYIFGQQADSDLSTSLQLPRRDSLGIPEPSTRLGESKYLDSIHEDVASLMPARSTNRSNCLNMKLQLDALVVVMLLLPAGVTSISFAASPRGRLDLLRNAFALNVVAKALQVFGSRLQELTLITTPQSSARYVRAGSAYRELDRESVLMNSDVLSQLKKIQTLVIADERAAEALHQRSLMSEEQVQWHTLAPTVSRLELWDLACDCSEAVRFVRGFDHLTNLSIENVSLSDPRGLHLQRRRQDNPSIWLTFLVEVRRHMPALEVRLGALKLQRTVLTPSAVKWLAAAIPTGCTVGFERETRLMEDFESFLDLWAAEDSVRGEQAEEDRRDGRLVDAAMTSRWKTFANQR